MKKIPLGHGKFALVDDEDYPVVRLLKWHFGGSAVKHRFWCKGEGWFDRLHRFVMRAKPGQFVDHIDGNVLNNQKSNLRFCTISQNNRNRGMSKGNQSRFKGVSRSKDVKDWRARICFRRKRIMLGYFDTKIEAAKAYDRAAIYYHGQFSKTNLSMGLYDSTD